MKDLFGQELWVDPSQLSGLELKRFKRRQYAIPRGYAARPGTGPEGETCKTCRHYFRKERYPRAYRKCALTKWTRGPKTDIKASSPACAKWETRDDG
jgi:hypothetical protein